MNCIQSDQKNELLNWYSSMKNLDFEKAYKMKQEFDKDERFNKNSEVNTLYKLMNARYYLLYKNLEKFASIIAEIEIDEDDDKNWLNYYYHFFRGIYHFERKEYKLSLSFYQKANPLGYELGIQEIAEFYYKVASALIRTYRNTLSINYLNKALKIFTESANFDKISSCEMLLGINHEDIFQFEEAEIHYREALRYAEKANSKLQKIRVLHNLAVLYSKNKMPESALNFLEQIPDLQLIENRNHYLSAQIYYEFALNYFLTDQIEKARQYLKDGLDISTENDHKDYFYLFKMLECKFIDDQEFVTVYSNAVKYFKEHDLLSLTIEYSEELAHFFGKLKQFKDACHYYTLSIETRKIIEKERVHSI